MATATTERVDATQDGMENIVHSMAVRMPATTMLLANNSRMDGGVVARVGGRVPPAMWQWRRHVTTPLIMMLMA